VDALFGIRAAQIAVYMDSVGRWEQRIHGRECAGSRLKQAAVGKRPVPARCRVPYWRDASPWRRRKSRGTAEAA
jgi:hypothetical protein